jgi:cytochrome-b5 reductase
LEKKMSASAKDEEVDDKLKPGGTTKATRVRKKVPLGVGYSAMDWARLSRSGTDLSGTGGRLYRVTMDEVAKHKSVDDAWTVIRGRVYNLTAYLKFHPGGVDELMKAAGRDGTKLFDHKHAWLNAESLLAGCFIGPLRF